jgi:hypothetical protein
MVANPFEYCYFRLETCSHHRDRGIMKPHPTSALLSGLLLAACAPIYSLAIQTEPQGALLVEQGTGAQFRSPAVLTYQLTEQHRGTDGCFRVRPVVAHWASGVTAGSSDLIPLCGSHTSWTLMIERPAGAPSVEQDLAAAAARQRELELAQIEQEIRRLESQAYAASNWEQAGYAMGCAIAGGCTRSGLDSVWTGSASHGSSSQGRYQSPTMAPDGSFVIGQPTLCPDGTFVGGGECSLAPDGSHVGGRPRLAPDGTFVGEAPTLCPDGTFVGGSRCVMAPDGTFLGQD